MIVFVQFKIYYIVYVDWLFLIIVDGCLWCDVVIF